MIIIYIIIVNYNIYIYTVYILKTQKTALYFNHGYSAAPGFALR